LRGEAIDPVADPDTVSHLLRENTALIRRWSADSRVAFTSTPLAEGWSLLDFESCGYTGAEVSEIGIEGLSGPNEVVRLVADTNGDGLIGEGDSEVPVRLMQSGGEARLVLEKPLPLLPGIDTSQALPRPDPIHYRLFLWMAGDGARMAKVIQPRLLNRVTGAAVTPSAGPSTGVAIAKST